MNLTEKITRWAKEVINPTKRYDRLMEKAINQILLVDYELILKEKEILGKEGPMTDMIRWGYKTNNQIPEWLYENCSEIMRRRADMVINRIKSELGYKENEFL